MFVVRATQHFRPLFRRNRHCCRSHEGKELVSSELPQRLVVFDGFFLLFRAFHSLPHLGGVGALYGLAKVLLDAHRKLPAAFFVVAFDSGDVSNSSGGFLSERRKILGVYKRNRKPPPEQLVPQFARARELCREIGIPYIDAPWGAEADDVIASCVTGARDDGLEAVIVSSDKDLQQLVTDDGPRVSIAIPGNLHQLWGQDEVFAAHGVLPSQLGDLLALAGDASDGVPGVPGVGPKLARRLLDAYCSLELLLKAAEAGDVAVPGFGAKRLEALRREAENVRLYRRVVELRRDLSVPNTRDLCWRPDGGLAACFDRFGFPSLARQAAAERMQSAVRH